eukprot:TRINITY_DN2162_c0_g1_i1.p1 TRINITY_DN2162_c0_g1~~TRINITY_DN2162_c0_g1_i1.p1  ORF type:complete len:391 (+),score=80.76 TRINITY_DN2162_c0_g1_i1:112-1284(+)
MSLIIPDVVLLKDELSVETQKMDQLIERIQTEIIEDVMSALDTLAFGVFIPWCNKQNQLNKYYFAEKGGLKICVDLIKKCQLVPLKVAVGHALWNFAEDAIMIQALWNDKCFEAVVEFLYSNQRQLEFVALGFLSAFLEFDTKAEIVTDVEPKLIKQIVDVAKVHLVRFKDLSKAENATNQKIVYCSLLVSTFNEKTNHILFDCGGLDMFLYPSSSVTITKLSNFYCTLGAALLYENPLNRLKKKDKKEVINKVSSFIKTYTPREMRDVESESGSLWTCLNPMYKLTESQEFNIQQMGLHCLTNFSYSDMYREQFITEELLDKIVCLQWHPDKRAHKYTSIIIQNLTTTTTSTTTSKSTYPAPSLKQLCMFNIQHKYPQLLKKVSKLNLY